MPRLGGGGIFLTQCLDSIVKSDINVAALNTRQIDRVIVLTDEQDMDRKCPASKANAYGKRNYIINVSCDQNGVAYNKFTHINGWSEHVIDYIRELETLENSIATVGTVSELSIAD